MGFQDLCDEVGDGGEERGLDGCEGYWGERHGGWGCVVVGVEGSKREGGGLGWSSSWEL